MHVAILLLDQSILPFGIPEWSSRIIKMNALESGTQTTILPSYQPLIQHYSKILSTLILGNLIT